MEKSPSSSSVRVAEFDGLRGIAIALVLWHHLAEPFLPSVRESWLGWLRVGLNLSWCGVDLFFVLSGFFIGGILIDRRDAPRFIRVFYLRRATRILPLYYITLAAIGALCSLGLGGAYHLFAPWLYGLFLTNFALAAAQTWDWLPLSVLWSLAVEEQFYLLAPWVIRLVGRGFFPHFAVGLALLAWSARLGLLAWFPRGHFAAQVLTPLRMDALALGALVAWIVRSPHAERFYSIVNTWRRPLLGLGLILFATLTALRVRDGDAVLCVFGYAAIAVLFALLVSVVAGIRPRRLSRALSLPALAHLGRHSYFIYLWHGLIGIGFVRWLGGANFKITTPFAFVLPALAVGLTWAAAIVSWRFFEGPIVAWGQRQRY